jgi:transcriptional regulator with XRE-family HTH domain
MQNKKFTDNIIFLAGDKKWGWIHNFAIKCEISERHARSILSEGVFPNSETLQKIAGAYNITVDALLTDPAEIKRAKEDQLPHLTDPELAEMIKDDEFKKLYDDTIDVLKKIKKANGTEAAGDMIGALKHVYRTAMKREKEKG